MKFALITLLTVLVLSSSPMVFAASTKEEIQALRTQIEETQEDIDEIKEDIDDIKDMLEEGARAPAARPSRPTFQEQTVELGDSPYLGDNDAPVTIIEYSDYQCPFCARNHTQVFPQLKEEYVETGKVKFVMREFPLTSIHQNAFDASLAALCAKDEGKYWEMADLLFANQRALTAENLKTYAEQLDLDTESFNECLDERKYEKAVQNDLATGARLGMSGTPGFYIGLTDPEEPGKADLSVFVRGAQSIDQFRASINDLLESANEG